MTTIPLNRRFYEWRDSAAEIADSRRLLGLSGGTLGWSDLLTRRRVVVLAEAGSGKSEELSEQARQLKAADKFAFYMTVQDVGRGGLEKAIRVPDRRRLQAWRESNQAGWFFVDSIDEAKLDHINLDWALRNLAEGIAGAEGRAHVVLSGRHTDWEFARDARRLQDELPLPADDLAEPLPTLRTLVRRVLRHEERPKPKDPEIPLIVVMAPLDTAQVRAYAQAKKAPDVEGLLVAIETGYLHEFARRPVDLEWIVRYWHAHGRLGNFSTMLAESLRERLQEQDPDRSRRDGLNTERALRGLERIGATLVFGRKATIAIPDKDARPHDDPATITIDGVLPDWSSEERLQLLSRPAFDPSTFGRARLHSDNEGVVRAYLTAQWLLRLRQANLPLRRLHSLVFARNYDIDLIRPSMLETAAWLCLWDESVATEVVRRAPFLLFTAGDPACLPLKTRETVLHALVTQMLQGEEVPLLDLSSVTRFAQPDIAPALRAIWRSSKQHKEVRIFVLRLIWLGAIEDCADIAADEGLGPFKDNRTSLIAGRALLATGDSALQQTYAAHIKRDCTSLPASVVWEGVEGLFPQYIGVDDLAAMLTVVHQRDEMGNGLSSWGIEKLVGNLSSPGDLARLIVLILQQLRAGSKDAQAEETEMKIAAAELLASAAKRILELSPRDSAPEAAIDAVLYLGDRRNHFALRGTVETNDAVEELHKTPERRRAAFWRAANHFGSSEDLYGRGLVDPLQMQFLGWSPGLGLDDIDWLLIDGPARNAPNERRLAINAALRLWDQAARAEELRARIASVAASTPETDEAYEQWMQPPTKSPELLRSEAELAEATRENQRQRAEQEQSWVEFVENLRDDPDQLRRPMLAPATTVDSRLYYLWQLLQAATRSDSRYAIDNVAPIVEIAGASVAARFIEGLSAMWRTWTPTLRSARPPMERNQINMLDCMGIAAVSIEAATHPDWASRLTATEAVRAAEYATLELNGLPKWITSLAEAWPIAVEDVLTGQAIYDLNNPDTESYCQSLNSVERADDVVARVMAEPLWRELRAREDLNPRALQPVLSVLRRGLSAARQQELYDMTLVRFAATEQPQTAALYLGAAYAIDAKGATDALVDKLNHIGDAEKTSLVERVLPQIFGSRISLTACRPAKLDLPTLERLVVLAYRTVRVEDDHDRMNGRAYSPDERDDAQDARSAAFGLLANTPGRATVDALLRLIEIPGFPISPARLRALVLQRASEDAEAASWESTEAQHFEARFERRPVTGRDLQLVALNRLEDLQHDLVHGDFQQGTTLSSLPDEPAVQAWLADRLRLAQGTSYSIEREPETVQRKKPDLVFTAKAGNAKVPAEIKVASSWTVVQLEEALENQLCGQYLRAQDCRDGIFVLVQQVRRARGWELADGSFITFEQLAQRLHDLAAHIRQRGSLTGPQPEVAVIDVANCAPRRLEKADKNT